MKQRIFKYCLLLAVGMFLLSELWACTQRGANKPKGASRTVVIYPLAGCAVEAERFLKNTAWQTNNQQQARFITMLPAIRREKTLIPELVSKASENNKEINDFLASKGFSDLRLSPWSPPDFGVAAVLKVQEQWLKKGAEDTVYADAEKGYKKYSGVALSDGLTTYTWQETRQPVIGIKTKTGDVVYLVEFPKDELPKGDFGLLDLAAKLLKEKVPDRENPIVQVTFPIAELVERPDISWLVGMRLGSAKIAQAIQETRIKLDTEGATVESAAAMGVTRSGGGPRLYQVTQPFLCVITRPGLSQPFLVAYLAQDSWKELPEK